MTALPSDVAAVRHITFDWGFYCPEGTLCPASDPRRGIVVFGFGPGVPDGYVEVEKVGESVRVVTELTPTD